jgi:signal transduction histidine kinase
VSEDADLAAARLHRLEAEARVALERTRHLSRDLRPAALDDLGLVGAVVEAGRTLGVQVRVGAGSVPDLSPAAQVAAYRIATEAVLNAQRHAHADVVDLTLRLDGDTLVVGVVDHGPGLGDARTGVGLRSMRERAVELGGTLKLEGTPGGGLTVTATIPGAVASAGAR